MTYTEMLKRYEEMKGECSVRREAWDASITWFPVGTNEQYCNQPIIKIFNTELPLSKIDFDASDWSVLPALCDGINRLKNC